ncbi:endothelial lipase-like [Cylas formicarius]|uniref:endothelial lipase-like n=1 Tax=Cylas formicarius TaxID=197179 RepID=UPI0029589D19|nr:endothelial lipase-like [Cylas formicarius]
MKIFISLVLFLAFSTALPVDTDESEYLLYETEEGRIEVEDLNNSTIEAYATENDITFYFFTSTNKDLGVEIKESQLHDIIKLTGFDVRKQTLVIIHGWKNHFESPVNDVIKSAAISHHDINIIVVDWSPISGKNYVTAKNAVVRVGNYIGNFLLRLKAELHKSLSRVTIVGHSLGAHIAGNVGAATNGLIDNIVGLDPAGPLFSERNTDNRLDPTDAKFVQVIHTNDGRLGFGINMGDVDFYPNGGRSQPGCGLDVTGSCAHSRAYTYYAESLVNNEFIAYLCESERDFNRDRCTTNSKSRMGGFPVDKKASGEYYLNTNSRPPYALGD